jgi:3-hydroxybutyryl-CoA dehydrogenase
MKANLGPFEYLDRVGLKTIWDILNQRALDSNDPQLHKNAEFVKKFVEEGNLGLKTGKGFYIYL